MAPKDAFFVIIHINRAQTPTPLHRAVVIIFLIIGEEGARLATVYRYGEVVGV